MKKCTISECKINLRVRYYEVDRQRAVHHSNYAGYFEMGRTELLRINGYDYKTLEESGVILVVAKLECRFRSPARYDDVLEVHTKVKKVDRVRLEHAYTIRRESDNRIIAEGGTTLVHVDAEGKLQSIPEYLKG